MTDLLPFPRASQQPEFSALQIEPFVDGVLDQAVHRDMTVLAWSPLGGGNPCKVGWFSAALERAR